MYLLMADTNVGYLWNAETNGALVFGTGGAERARITSAGKFGIGTNAPSNQLEVVGPASVTVGLTAGGAGFAELELVGQAGKNYITSDDTLSFDIGGEERATVSTTGLNVTSGTLSQGGTAVSLSGHSHGGVTSITGTANQVVASASTGAVTLSLPQSIGTANSPLFNTIKITPDNAGAVTTSDGEFVYRNDEINRIMFNFLGTEKQVYPVPAASTSTPGAVYLSTSTSDTSTTTAATPSAVKTAYDTAVSSQQPNPLQRVLYGATTAHATHLRNELTTTNTNTSGQVILTRIYFHYTKTLANISVTSGATASASLTYCAFGIYTRSGTTFTRVAVTSSDTTIFNTANTKYTRATTTSPTLSSSTEYYIGILQVGTTMATTLAGTARADTSANAATGVQVYTVASQTTLASSLTGVAHATRSDHAEVT
jgi:hypothetical protein